MLLEKTKSTCAQEAVNIPGIQHLHTVRHGYGNGKHESCRGMLSCKVLLNNYCN